MIWTKIPTTGVPTNCNAHTFHNVQVHLLHGMVQSFYLFDNSRLSQHRPTSTNKYPCTDPSHRRRPRTTAHEIYPVSSSPTQASQSPVRHTASPPRGPQPSSFREKTNPFTHTLKGSSIEHPAKTFAFTNLKILSASAQPTVFMSPSGSTTHRHHHTTHAQVTASSCSLGQMENEYVQEGQDRDLPLKYLHFPISHRFTERFWHQSQYFFDLADRQNNYLNTFLTRDVAPYRTYQKYDPFYLKFGFLHPTQMDVNGQIHKVNRVKKLQTIHNYLFVQHRFDRTNPLIHMNSRLQYANPNLTSPLLHEL